MTKPDETTIQTNSNKKYVDTANSKQDIAIADKANKSYVDGEIAKVNIDTTPLLPRNGSRIKIKNTTKQKKSLNWLGKQRDGVIGFVEEEINKLRHEIENLIEKLDLVTNSFEELVNLNDEIYDIEINSDE